MHVTPFEVLNHWMWAPRVSKQRYTRTPGIVLQSYRSHRSSGLGYGDLTELTEIPGSARKCCRIHRSSGYCGTGVQNSHKSLKLYTRTPGICGTGVQNFQKKFRVRVWMSYMYRTSRISGYGYECPTELADVLCRVLPGVNTYPGWIPGYGFEYPTEHNLGYFFRSADSVGSFILFAAACCCSLFYCYSSSSVHHRLFLFFANKVYALRPLWWLHYTCCGMKEAGQLFFYTAWRYKKP